MDRTFEGRVDSEGLIAIPNSIRERHGLTNGARVRIEEQGDKVILEAIAPNGIGTIVPIRKNITDLAGFLSEDSNALAILLEERNHPT